ncbi:MAG: hypothetical protein R3B72_51700 [Polyangiaceae bacterium]
MSFSPVDAANMVVMLALGFAILGAVPGLVIAGGVATALRVAKRSLAVKVAGWSSFVGVLSAVTASVVSLQRTVQRNDGASISWWQDQTPYVLGASLAMAIGWVVWVRRLDGVGVRERVVRGALYLCVTLLVLGTTLLWVGSIM